MKRIIGLIGPLLLGLAAAAEEAGTSEAALRISVLTYNTHGLPSWAAGDRPELRFPRIAALAASYDVALFQEDFAHHELLLVHTRHPLVLRGNGPRWSWLGGPPVFAGSGLTLASRFRPDRVVAQRAAAYEQCAGWIGGGNDCWARKGFLLVRLRLGNGAELDIWNTHLDAGRRDADHEARSRQLERLRPAIARESAGRSLILAGDLNLDFDTPRDRELLDRFLERLALVDTGARPARGLWAGRLDYVLFRSAAETPIVLEQAGVAGEFVDQEGLPLSDHPALYARFRLR